MGKTIQEQIEQINARMQELQPLVSEFYKLKDMREKLWRQQRDEADIKLQEKIDRDYDLR